MKRSRGEALIRPPTRTENAMRFLRGLAIWLGVGFLLHALLIGPTIDPWSVMTWGYIVGWPVLVAFSILKWGTISLIWIAALLLGVGSIVAFLRASLVGGTFLALLSLLLLSLLLGH